jgi:glutathione S-transferase
MAEIIIHTNVWSPYGWTARHVAAEKGVSSSLAPVDTASPEYRRLHPFGKMPVMTHGERVVYETLAIAHYIDRAFPGPALQPPDVVAQSEVLRWISVVNAYLHPVMNGLVKERTAGSWRIDGPNEAAIAAFRGPLPLQMTLIDAAVTPHPFLVGDAVTLADSFLLPQLHFVGLTPEGSETLAALPAARAWLERMCARPSFAATNPLAVPQ